MSIKDTLTGLHSRYETHNTYTFFSMYNRYFLLVFLTILSSIIFLIPFIINDNIHIVFQYWDGPNYAYLAKSLYNVPADHPLSPYTKPEYFAAHLPIYPLTIRLFAFLGYNNAMLLSTLLYTVFATLALFQLLKETRTVKSPFWSALISLFLPARYLIYHNVGATEAPFIFFTLSSMLAYLRGHYALAFILGGLSGITRITGILIGVAYFFALVWEKKWKYIPLLALVGLPLLLTFTFYHFHYGNFFAYFGVNLSSSNSLIHLKPFDILRLYSNRGEAHSAEFYLAMYAVYGAGVAVLWHKNKLFFLYGAVTYLFSIFIFHQDLARYFIPLSPFALVIAYDDLLSKKAVKLAAVPFIILSYIYAWGVLPHNGIVDWVYQNLLKYLVQ